MPASAALASTPSSTHSCSHCPASVGSCCGSAAPRSVAHRRLRASCPPTGGAAMNGRPRAAKNVSSEGLLHSASARAISALKRRMYENTSGSYSSSVPPCPASPRPANSALSAEATSLRTPATSQPQGPLADLLLHSRDQRLC